MEVPLVRTMVRADLPSVVWIEKESCDYHWSEKDFISTLRQRKTIGLTAKFEEEVVGFLIYEFHKTHFKILNLAVSPNFRRKGVGTAMISKLKAKLNNGGDKTRLKLEVRESNLEAQLFCRALGFRAVNVQRHRYTDVDESAYIFVYRNKQESNLDRSV